MAIYGDSFVPSACSSFNLIWCNLARVAAIHLVSGTLLTIGKVLVALLSAGSMSFIIMSLYENDISSIAVPTFLAFIIAFLVASLFMVTYDTVIDTMFLCFLVDEKFNQGTGQMYASPSLIALVDGHAKLSKEHAEKLKASSGSVSSENYQSLPHNN